MDIVRYGIIGIQGVGETHLRLAQKHQKVELTALVDIDSDAVKYQAQELGIRSFTDYRDLLDADLVDAVSIATPHNLHGEIGLACLNAGIHIFVEKPLANTVYAADAMLSAALLSDLKICVGHQYRTYRTPQRMKEIIDSDILGPLHRILWTWLEFRPDSYYRRDPWRTNWRQAGGGVLLNQTSHDLDLICWLAGAPVEVSAQIGKQLHSYLEVEDVACATARFEGGALASFQGSVNQPGAFSLRQLAGDRAMMVIQDVKSLTGDQTDEILLGHYGDALSSLTASIEPISGQPPITWESINTEPSSTDSPTGHELLLHSFVMAILQGGEPYVTGQSARTTVEFINAIVLSALKKRTVELPLDPAEYDELFSKLVNGEMSL